MTEYYTKKTTKRALCFTAAAVAVLLLCCTAFTGAAAADITITSIEDWKNNVSGKNIQENITLETNLSFADYEGNPMIYILSGNFDGGGHTISDYVIIDKSVDCAGLIRYFQGNRIANLTIRNFSVTSESTPAGGLVGYGRYTENYFENVHAEFGSVSNRPNGYDAGGLIAVANWVTFVNCSVSNCCISSGEFYVGGLIGSAGFKSTPFMSGCTVTNCSIFGGHHKVGGLAGSAIDKGSMTGTLFLSGCTVTNCIITSDSYDVGGLIGNRKVQGGYASGQGIVDCEVVNCTVAATNTSASKNVGGLIGSTDSGRFFTNCRMTASGILGSVADSVAMVVGYDNGVKKGFGDGAADGGGNYLNDNNNTDYPIIIPRDTERKEAPPGTILISNLSDIGYCGMYNAISYVILKPTHTVTIDTGLMNGRVNAVPNGTVGEETTVNLYNLAIPGYHFVKYIIYNTENTSVTVSNSSNQFTMPAYNVTVSGIISANVTHVIFNNGTGTETIDNTFNETFLKPADPSKPGSSFIGWNISTDGGLTWGSFEDNKSYVKDGIWNYTGIDGGSLEVFAEWEVSSYNITYIEPVGGSVSGAVSAYFGETVMVTASPSSGYRFNKLIVTKTDAADVVSSTGNSFTMPDYDVNVTALFKSISTHSPDDSDHGSSIWLKNASLPIIDITWQYEGVNFLHLSSDQLKIVRGVKPEYADRLERNLSLAKDAGLKVINGKGSPSLAVAEIYNQSLDLVRLCRVYDVITTKEYTYSTKVTLPVPIENVVSAGLTTDDVTIYQYADDYRIWLPLDTREITTAGSNYYYTVEPDDGLSRFGVLIKRFETKVSEIPETPASPVPFAGLLLGLGAAAVLLRLRK